MPYLNPQSVYHLFAEMAHLNFMKRIVLDVFAFLSNAKNIFLSLSKCVLDN